MNIDISNLLLQRIKLDVMPHLAGDGDEATEVTVNDGSSPEVSMFPLIFIGYSVNSV